LGFKYAERIFIVIYCVICVVPRGFLGHTVPGYLRFICIKVLGRIVLSESGTEPRQDSSSERQNAELDAYEELIGQLNVSSFKLFLNF